MSFTINEFWKTKIPAPAYSQNSPIKGWHTKPDEISTFKEAPLSIAEKFGTEAAPEDAPIILISAPGAVGKSTLARQIAHQTGATYIDLAEAEPVGGNTLSGGLAKSGMYPDWQSGSVIVMVDALDEARLKVTQEAFEAFLSDVADISRGRTVPTVLFGRSGAVEDAWLFLSERVQVSVLEIGYYAPPDAFDFAVTHFEIATKGDQHRDVGREAIRLLIDGLRADTSSDGDRFSGYAPVLQAVANRVASDSNRGALIAKIKKGDQPVTLQTIVAAILSREQGKLSQLTFEDPSLAHRLYSPEEQLQRLAAHVYRSPPPDMVAMSAADSKIYTNALKTWVPEHPFLDGGANTASAVFGAVVTSAALRFRNTSAAALNKAISEVSANPFLSEFYIDSIKDEQIPPEHIGVVYASIRSRLSLGDSASLAIEGAEEGDELERLRAEIEISVARSDMDQPRILNFQSDQAGPIKLGARIEDVEVVAPHARVEIGGAQETVLVAPISIQCERIVMATPRLVVEGQSNDSNATVFLEADEADTSEVVSPPIVNGRAMLTVAWNGASIFPWTSYATTPKDADDPRTSEALRRFRKFVISFRSHSKGSLKRYAAKLDHERMTKGSGRAVLNHMVKSGVLSLDGSMYTLHPGMLADKAGVSYGMCMAREFPDLAIKFVQEALADS